MVKHIVMWKIKNSEYKQDHLVKIKDALEGLKNKVSQILELEVGLDFGQKAGVSADIVLISLFASQEDLELYQNHPEHKKAAEIIQLLTSERRVVDYYL